MFLGKYVSPWFDEYEEDVLAKQNMDFILSDYFLDLKRAAQSFQSHHQKETQLIHVKLLKSSSRPKRRKISARIRKRRILSIKMTKQNQQQNNLSSALKWSRSFHILSHQGASN